LSSGRKSDRAKIFASFSPLKGFEEKLLQKEKIIVPKSELSEDRIEEIEYALQRLSVGDMITVIFYSSFHDTNIQQTLRQN
jgi:hypothetical protein